MYKGREGKLSFYCLFLWAFCILNHIYFLPKNINFKRKTESHPKKLEI